MGKNPKKRNGKSATEVRPLVKAAESLSECKDLLAQLGTKVGRIDKKLSGLPPFFPEDYLNCIWSLEAIHTSHISESVSITLISVGSCADDINRDVALLTVGENGNHLLEISPNGQEAKLVVPCSAENREAWLARFFCLVAYSKLGTNQKAN